MKKNIQINKQKQQKKNDIITNIMCDEYNQNNQLSKKEFLNKIIEIYNNMNPTNDITKISKNVAYNYFENIVGQKNNIGNPNIFFILPLASLYHSFPEPNLYSYFII